MFIDASALVAMLTDEDDGTALADRMERAKNRMTSPAALWETVINVARIFNLPIADVKATVEEFVAASDIQVMSIPPKAGSLAIDAFEQFGKGRHPASLNFGDCMAYACARYYRMPLLFKGHDFPKTDIEPA